MPTGAGHKSPTGAAAWGGTMDKEAPRKREGRPATGLLSLAKTWGRRTRRSFGRANALSASATDAEGSEYPGAEWSPGKPGHRAMTRHLRSGGARQHPGRTISRTALAEKGQKKRRRREVAANTPKRMGKSASRRRRVELSWRLAGALVSADEPAVAAPADLRHKQGTPRRRWSPQSGGSGRPKGAGCESNRSRCVGRHNGQWAP